MAPSEERTWCNDHFRFEASYRGRNAVTEWTEHSGMPPSENAQLYELKRKQGENQTAFLYTEPYNLNWTDNCIRLSIQGLQLFGLAIEGNTIEEENEKLNPN